MGKYFGMAALVVSCSLAGMAHAEDLRDIRISLMPFPEVAPIYIAMEKGFFEENGLKVEIVPSSSGAAAIPGLIGGSFEFAYGNIVSNILAIDRGLDLKILSGTTYMDLEGSGIITLANSGITSGKDLEGKVLGVNARNNVVWLFARAWVRATGGDPDKVQYKEVSFPQMEDALLGNQVDATFMSNPFWSFAIQDARIDPLSNPYAEIQPKVQIGQYSTTGWLIENEPEVVEGFLAALKMGSDWYDANIGTDELNTIISGFTGMSIENVAAQPLLPAYSGVDLTEMEFTIQMMVEEDMVDSAPDIATLVHQQ